jgi:AraC-like DNA-binding protein
VGVPVTSYIQWFKVLKAVKYTLGGLSMTDAAHEGNFADSAHFSRAFKGMFGKSLSKYLNDSRIVQVIFI